MKNISSIILIFLIGSICFANSAPVVSNVTAIQRTDGSKKVDIRYNLSDADGDKCTVSVQVSSDGGNTWMVPATSFTEAVGGNISPGNNKLIIWDCIKDLPGVFGSNYQIRIIADDNYDPSGMVWVYINDPGVSGHEGFNGYMSKYETTNAQYCQFLNDAKVANQITVYNNVVYAISDTSHSQPYYDLAGLGINFNGATNGGAARINYTGNLFTVDSGFENHPVTYISWYGAVAFCNYYGYRLPTEWEWQAVADYTDNRPYPCGTTINNNKANYAGSNHPYGTTAVGAFGTYGYGMCDMAGNVWELTSTVSGSYRIWTSGSWTNIVTNCAVSYRYSYYPNFMYNDIGFRVCRTVEPSGMVWVYINDSGAGMKDKNGNLIYHGGFTGYMSKYETTNAQYCQFLNAALNSNQITVYNNIVYAVSDTSYSHPYFGTYACDSSSQITYSGGTFGIRSRDGYSMANHPVVMVSWYGATAFCNYYGYRLPTEWEWQAAADYNGSFTYGCGTTISQSKANYYDNGYANPLGLTTYPYTSPVGYYPAYGYGMCDMAGNVFEWTSSLSYSDRCIRGGCWSHYGVNNYTVAYRSNSGPYILIDDIGFRACRSVSGCGLSNIFPIDNQNAITVSATNNWDGTVTVTWTERGSVKFVRQEVDNPSNKTEWYLSGSLEVDTLQLSELKKKYIYIIKDLSGTELGRTSQEVRPDIVVVLVRGYDAFGNGIDTAVPSKYWSGDHDGLVEYVKTWFENKGMTCWDATAILNGTHSVTKNAGYLKTFVDGMRAADANYQDAKIHLFGHSMGGLISRKFANDYPGVAKKIFCAQTPHTGSPLAEIRGLWPNNEATYCLFPAYLIAFNASINIGETKLYSTYSINAVNLCWDPGLIAAAAIISGLQGIYAQMYIPNTSDGAVPTASAMGKLWLIDQIHIDELYNSNLDHYSCYRHINTLNKVMEWLGYPQPGGSMLKMQADEMSMESEEEPSPLYFIAGFTGEFNSGQPVSKTVKISGGQKAYFRAIVSDMNSTFTLRNPFSTMIDPCVAASDPNIEYNQEDGVMAYEITTPQGGTWTMNLTTTIADPNLVQYGLTAFEDQQITLSAYSSSEWINTGRSVVLKADISSNAGAITGATVLGVITLPNTTNQNIIFYDDGTHGDSNANDGTYSYLFNSTSLEGRYNVDIKATGLISGGGNFERTATTSFTASNASVSINGSITDAGIDQNDNSHYDVLRITVPVDVNDSGKYRLTASLLDDSNDTITLINSGEIKLEPLPEIAAGDLDGNKKVNFIDYSMFANMWQAGTVDISDLAAMAGNWLEGTIPAVITIDVPADEFAKHGTDGPFKLVSIEITDANSGMIITTAGDYTTSAYSLTDFELLDTDKDGLPDSLENTIGTDPNKVDTDEDGATDCQEVSVDGNSTSYNPLTDSNPLVKDTDGDSMTDGYEISYGLNPLIDDTLDDLDDDGLTNIQEYNLHTRPDTIDTDEDGRNDKWEVDNLTNPLVYEVYTKIAGDINLDSTVNILDIKIIASQWLGVPGIPSADIAPSPIDGIVNMLDFAVFAENWMEE